VFFSVFADFGYLTVYFCILVMTLTDYVVLQVSSG